MNTYRIISRSLILINFKTESKMEFEHFRLMCKISLEGNYDPVRKKWFVGNSPEDISRLQKYGFVQENKKYNPFQIILNNSTIKVKGKFEDLISLHSYFVQYNYKFCYMNGEFIYERVYRVNFSKFDDKYLILPIGFLKDLKRFLYKNKIEFQQADLRSDLVINKEEVKRNLHYTELYDYQTDATITCMKKKNCIVKLPTSSGKTEIFLSLCNLIPLRTLILFNSIELAKQTKDRANSAGLDTGLVQGDNVDEDHRVVMCTVQSAGKIKRKYKMIIVDEVHQAGTKQYWNILKSDEFIYRFGFSATPFPKNKLRKALIKKWIGDIEYLLPATKLIELKKIAEPHITMYKIEEPRDIYFDDGWMDAENNCIINNYYRNEIIKNIALENKFTMILVKKIKHGELLEKMIPGSIFIHGKSKIVDREIVKQKFINGEIILIASRIYDQGISVNEIRCLIIAGGGLSYIVTLQRIGRGLRIMDDKDSVDIHDFIDNTNYILKDHSRNRKKDYKKEGYTKIKIIKLKRGE